MRNHSRRIDFPSPPQAQHNRCRRFKQGQVQGPRQSKAHSVPNWDPVSSWSIKSSALSGNPFFPSSRSFLCSWLHNAAHLRTILQVSSNPKEIYAECTLSWMPSSRYFNPTSSSGVVHRISFCLAHYTHHPCFLCSQCSYVWSLVPFNCYGHLGLSCYPFSFALYL